MSAQPASSEGPWRRSVGQAKRPTLSLYARPPDAVLETERRARLHMELAAWVVAADLALMQEQMEHWRAIAFERERALAGANATVNVLSETIAAMTLAMHEPQRDNAFVVWPRPPELANVPDEVRDAVARYRARPRAPRWWEDRR